MLRCSPLSYVFENNPVARPVDARHSIESETGKAVTVCLESEMFQQAKVEAKARVHRQSLIATSVDSPLPLRRASLRPSTLPIHSSARTSPESQPVPVFAMHTPPSVSVKPQEDVPPIQVQPAPTSPHSSSSSSESDDGEIQQAAPSQLAFTLPEMPHVNWGEWLPCLGRGDMKKPPAATNPPQPPAEEDPSSSGSDED